MLEINPKRLISQLSAGHEDDFDTEEAPHGRMSQEEWEEFCYSVLGCGVKSPVVIDIQRDSDSLEVAVLPGDEILIQDGNHRTRAAIETKLDSVPVEIQAINGYMI